jgi:hypothetical protein
MLKLDFFETAIFRTFRLSGIVQIEQFYFILKYCYLNFVYKITIKMCDIYNLQLPWILGQLLYLYYKYKIYMFGVGHI